MRAPWKKFSDELPRNDSKIFFTDISGDAWGSGYFLLEDKNEWDKELYWMYVPKVEIQ